MENTRFCIFNQEIQVFEVWLFVLPSNPALATEKTKIRDHFVLQSVDLVGLCRQRVPKRLFWPLPRKRGNL